MNISEEGDLFFGMRRVVMIEVEDMVRRGSLVGGLRGKEDLKEGCFCFIIIEDSLFFWKEIR